MKKNQFDFFSILLDQTNQFVVRHKYSIKEIEVTREIKQFWPIDVNPAIAYYKFSKKADSLLCRLNPYIIYRCK